MKKNYSSQKLVTKMGIRLNIKALKNMDDQSIKTHPTIQLSCSHLLCREKWISIN